MTDITIPAEDGKAIAAVLRKTADVMTPSTYADRLNAFADLLDPPAPSLRDEVATIIGLSTDMNENWHPEADEILAVVRRHVEALDAWDWDDSGMESVRKEGRDPGDWLDRDDVLRLLGGDE